MSRLLVILLAFAASPVFSQTEQGRFLVGGNFEVSSARQGTASFFKFGLTPTVGAFVVKNFAIGLKYSLVVNSTKDYNSFWQEYERVTVFNSGIGGMMRYYIGKKPIKGLLSVNADYITSTTLGDRISTTEGFDATGFAGMTYFINPHIGIESGFFFTGIKYVKQPVITYFGFSAGFYMYLDKKTKPQALDNGN